MISYSGAKSDEETDVSPKAVTLAKTKSFTIPLMEKLNVSTLEEIKLINYSSDE